MASRAEISGLSVEGIYEYLERTVDEDTIEWETLQMFKDNKINGQSFLDLTNDDLRELVPKLGERKAIKRLVDSFHPQQPGSSQAVVSSEIRSGCRKGELCQKYKLPDRFSRRVSEALSEGGIITKTVRSEIIAMIALGMWQHTSFPTPEEYTSICRDLVERFPILKDSHGNGFGSWKLQLRQKFKNMRREPGKKQDKESEDKDHAEPLATPPPAKKQRKHGDADHPSPPSDSDDEHNYDSYVAEICEIPTRKRLRRLMKKTFKLRRKWILEEEPTVSAILSKFPCLKEAKYLERELVALTSFRKEVAESNWTDFQQKIKVLAEKEATSRATVRDILDKQGEELTTFRDEVGVELSNVHAFELLAVLLPTRGKARVIMRFVASSSIESQTAAVQLNSPYLAVVIGDMSCEMYVICERVPIAQTSDCVSALISLIAAYFTFNMQYLTSFKSVLIFLQHIIFELKDAQTVPNACIQLCSTLDKM